MFPRQTGFISIAPLSGWSWNMLCLSVALFLSSIRPSGINPKEALGIIYPWHGYEDTLKLSALDTLVNCRKHLAVKFYAKAMVSVSLKSVLPSTAVVDYGLLPGWCLTSGQPGRACWLLEMSILKLVFYV